MDMASHVVGLENWLFLKNEQIEESFELAYSKMGVASQFTER